MPCTLDTILFNLWNLARVFRMGTDRLMMPRSTRKYREFRVMLCLNAEANLVTSLLSRVPAIHHALHRLVASIKQPVPPKQNRDPKVNWIAIEPPSSYQTLVNSSASSTLLGNAHHVNFTHFLGPDHTSPSQLALFDLLLEFLTEGHHQNDMLWALYPSTRLYCPSHSVPAR